ncbi:isoaspartyl peptidase/L-asparaginase family protein [Sphingomonas oligophenolica]|uniref:Isoaspartyl peptidase n=1 Tax=Sphingomonas oligophenolica TaxID=301154 RepID=A0A502CUS5_9SPHN|nr:isoaspartyl peptidase/L-asparaginase [Sphingomonas oligophenolica]TPG15501.1 isoaspartyl peptidase/L-asparaginase [Sphingomonas oligophenolica]
MIDPRWTLAIHGGAGQMTRDTVSAQADAGTRAGLATALDAGAAVLEAGGSAIDAVEAAVRVLEDDPHFNAGRGAVLTFDGTNELDAAIMDGRTRAAGAVAATHATRNPVSLARAVMDRSPHVFLVGKGADAFSVEHGVEQASPDWFATDERRAHLAELKAAGDDAFDVDMKYGTVGAVACDTHGHVAAATSTGGVTGKRWGRVGDSPVIGAGTYADDRGAAVSATGAGEYFLRVGVAADIAARVRLIGESLQVAADTVMAEVTALGGTGGVIVTGPTGEAVFRFTTPGMNRGVRSSDGTNRIAIYHDEGG